MKFQWVSKPFPPHGMTYELDGTNPPHCQIVKGDHEWYIFTDREEFIKIDHQTPLETVQTRAIAEVRAYLSDQISRLP